MNDIRYETEGTVFDIQRYSVHDGPGIRTILFLKGCPLSCLWCSNPESHDPKPQILYQDSVCIHCGKCVATCKQGALSRENSFFVDYAKCIACGACAEVCPSNALVLKGKSMTVWEAMQELDKDATLYRRTGGGVTLSGGEPLMQPEYALQVLRACHEKGWHTAMETTGLASREVVEKIFPHVDLVLMDIKSVCPETHKKATGVDNRRILENAIRIAALAKEVTVRVPVIPGVNADAAHIDAIARFAKNMPGVKEIHLLGYHSYGANKYGLLGREYPMGDTPNMKPEEVLPFKKIVEDHGFTCVVGG